MLKFISVENLNSKALTDAYFTAYGAEVLFNIQL